LYFVDEDWDVKSVGNINIQVAMNMQVLYKYTIINQTCFCSL